MKSSIPLIALILCSLLAFVGVLREYKRHFHAFSPSPQPLVSNYKKVIQPNAFFYTKVFMQRDKTFLSIPYKFDQGSQPLWLSLQTNVGTPAINRLMTHPVFTSLSWPKVTSGDITLYQKQKNYPSLEAFLQKPPYQAVIVIDPTLAKQNLFQKLKTIPLSDDVKTINLDTIDYFITTYIPSRQDEGVAYYETTFNATNALPNDKNELVWLIVAPLATETNPIYLGEIHVDYR